MEKPNITIEEIDFRIIYIRFRGTYGEFRKNSRKIFNEIFAFAKKNNLAIEGESKVLTIYDDNPFITDSKKLRTSVAMTIPKDIEVEESGNICLSAIKGKFGVGHFEISAKEYSEAWEFMYQDWLFKEGVVPRDVAPFELYVTEPPRNFKNKSFTDIYIPIK